MKKIKQLFGDALLKMGYTQDEIDKAFPEADGVEPVFDASAFLTKAQEYAKPLLSDAIEKEKRKEWQGKYMQTAIQQIAQMSGGLVKREDIEGKTVEDAMTIYNAKMKEASGMKDTDKDTMITELNKKLTDLQATHETALNATKVEFEGKESKRNIQDYVLGKLTAKKLIVPPATALRAVMTELESKYTMKFEDGKPTFYDKDGARLKNKDVTNFLEVDELITPIVTEYAWDKQSNGGGAAGGAIDLAGGLNLPKNKDGGLDNKSISPMTQAAINQGLIPAKAE